MHRLVYLLILVTLVAQVVAASSATGYVGFVGWVRNNRQLVCATQTTMMHLACLTVNTGGTPFELHEQVTIVYDRRGRAIDILH